MTFKIIVWYQLTLFLSSLNLLAYFKNLNPRESLLAVSGKAVGITLMKIMKKLEAHSGENVKMQLRFHRRFGKFERQPRKTT